jgi:hypothetical protein
MFWLTNNENFSEAFNAAYRPDIRLQFFHNDGTTKDFYMEIKVADQAISNSFDFKAGQVDYFLEKGNLACFFFICDFEKYALVKPEDIKALAETLISERLGGKPAYRMKFEDMKFRCFQEHLSIEKYDKLED